MHRTAFAARFSACLIAVVGIGLLSRPWSAAAAAAPAAGAAEEPAAGAAEEPAAEAGDGPAAEAGVTGELTEVTLFRDAARVTRVIRMEPGKGAREILVTQLPDLLVDGSVFAEGNASVQVRAVRIVREPQAESGREEVRQLSEQLEQLHRQKSRVESSRAVTEQNLQSLEQMIAFTSDASSSDLSRGVLNAETLTELVTFSMDQRATLNEQLRELSEEAESLQQRQQLLQRQLAEISEGDSKTRNQVKLFLDVLDDGPVSVELTYGVGGCRWSPQYTVSGELGSESFQLRYGAIVQQLSGEPWNDVHLTLSTASPSVRAAGPMLTPLRIRTGPADASSPAAAGPGQDPFGSDPFGNENQAAAADSNQQAVPQQAAKAPAAANRGYLPQQTELSGKLKSLRLQQRQIESEAGLAGAQASPVQRDLALNRLAGQMQQLELRAQASTARGLAPDAGEEVASQTYELPRRVSLDSRREEQLVEIVDADLQGELIHVATPLLSSFAYREAELTNDLGIGLLGGPASVYLDERFVGTTTLPTTAVGQDLVVGFGADQQIRTRRELMEKTDQIQGGNRQLGFRYRLVVSNFKDRDVAVRVMDRIPVSDQSQQISVALDPPERPLSDDSLYQRIARPRGILRWEVTVPAGSHGGDAFDITYHYQIEFDRSRSLTIPDLDQQTEQDLLEMRYRGGMGGGGMGGGN